MVEVEEEVDWNNAAVAVAEQVISSFESLPRNGTPTQPCRLLSVCMATGTKCLSNNAPLAYPGCTLADSHAEVLCRRAFNRYLLQSIDQQLSDSTYCLNPNCPIELANDPKKGEETEGKFQVKSNWEFWMYISDSPCGCASIYERMEAGSSYTGQKTVQVGLAASCPDSASPHPSPARSLLCTKPGRKDILSHLRSSSMSCSDKLARWMCLGMQGALLAFLLRTPVHLSGLVVSSDTGACEGVQKSALVAALSSRVLGEFSPPNSSCVQPVVPFIAVVSKLFTQGKSYSENLHPRHTALVGEVPQDNTHMKTAGMSKRQLKKAMNPSCKIKPAGNNLNWILRVPSQTVESESCWSGKMPPNSSGSVEVTLSSTGILQGCTVTTVEAARRHVPAEEGVEGPSKRARRNGKSSLNSDDSTGECENTPSSAMQTGNSSACCMPSFQSRLCRREFGCLFDQVLRKLDSCPGVACALSGVKEGGSGGLYSHEQYGAYKKFSKAYALKRQVFLQSEAFCDWLTDEAGKQNHNLC